jgi:hypothetical protein
MTLPNVTALLVAYLDPILDPIKVASRVPTDRPVELLQVRRVGGRGLPPVRDVARIDIFAWAATEPRAEEIGGTARSAVWALAGTDLAGVAVYTISEVLGPRLDDDEETGTHRSWTTIDVMVRADEIMGYAP